MPLLETKLYIPPPRRELVDRQALIRRLDEAQALGRQVILVSAPAGFGKTTLLSAWASQAQVPVAWLSLEEGDNDHVRFLTYLVAALVRVDPDLSSDMPDIGSVRPLQMEEFLTRLCNRLGEVVQPFMLILDDYHVIRLETIHNAVVFLLAHAPPAMHIAIVTRSDPPLPLARLRGRGRLIELRQDDLRFSVSEAMSFLHRVLDHRLPAEAVNALAERTEGWAAGLHMAALSLRGRDPRQMMRFVDAFTGSHHFILDYLMEEVLMQQEPGLQDFLLRTSILSQLSAELCDALMVVAHPGDAEIDVGTARPAASEVLHELEHANLFIVALDDQRCWYRYHHLFADLLRQRLRQTDPELVKELHRHASRWYEQQGIVAEAIGHALAAEDARRAADLIEERGDVTLMRSELATYQGWIEALPFDVLKTRLRLRANAAGMLLLTGSPQQAVEKALRAVEEDDAHDEVAGEIGVFRALMAFYRGDVVLSTALARSAMTKLPPSRLFLRSLVAGFLGLGHLMDGNFEEAQPMLDDAVRVSLEAGNIMNQVLALSHLAEIEFIRLRLDEAESLYEQAIEAARSDTGTLRPIAGVAMMGWGNLRRERNDLDGAEKLVTEALTLIEKWGDAVIAQAYASLARLCQAQGDASAAHNLMNRAWEEATAFDVTQFDDTFVAIQDLQILLAQDAWEQAHHLATKRGMLDAQGKLIPPSERAQMSHLLNIMEYSVVAPLLLHGDPDGALALVTDLLATATDRDWTLLQLMLQAVQALALDALGNEAAALSALRQSLTLLDKNGVLRLYIDLGAPMQRLLYRAVEAGITAVEAGRLLAAFPDSSVPTPPTGDLVAPLSERELEVLRLIAGGMTNQEIGRKLSISLPTVKWHTGNIYGKLLVKNRTQAVATARTLGLLGSIDGLA